MKNNGGEEVKDINIKTQVEIKNETEDRAELYLYGNIRQGWAWEDENVEAVTSKKVRAKLNSIGDKDLDIHLNTRGGDVFESIAIHNILKQHKGEVNIYIDALAGSGGSVIAMAGDKIYMPSNAMMMIHKAWAWVAGNATELRKFADDLDKMDIAVKESYKNRFVGTDEELSDLIEDETWLTADECKTFGFCDEVLNVIDDDKEGDEEGETTVENLFAKYSKEINTEAREKNLLNKFKIGGNK